MMTLDYQQALSILDPIITYFSNSPLELKRFQLISNETNPGIVYDAMHINADYAQMMLRRFMSHAFTPKSFRKGTISGEAFCKEAYMTLSVWGVPSYMFDALRYYTHHLLIRQHFDGKYARYGKKLLNALKRVVRPEYYQSVIAKCQLLNRTVSNDIKAMQIRELTDLLARYVGEMPILLTKIGMTEAQRNLLGYA